MGLHSAPLRANSDSEDKLEICVTDGDVSE
jgi:hypothetical protein